MAFCAVDVAVAGAGAVAVAAVVRGVFSRFCVPKLEKSLIL